MKLSSSKNSAVILLSVLVVVLLFAIYYYVVLPKKNEVESLETSVGSIKSEISTLKSEIAQIEEEQEKGSSKLYSLRKKVPEDRDIDQLILNIEEIEYVTGSRILSIEFNNYDQSVADSNISPTNDENTSENTSEQTTNEEGTETEGQTEEQPISSIANLQLPPALKLVTFSIELEAPSHKKLREFIGEVEKLERVMHVDTIEYEVPGEEQEFEENPKESVEATIQITTFFYTGK